MDAIPIYQQLRRHLQTIIQLDRLQVNDKLPSERELVEQFNTTRITLRDALVKLESEGLIYRQNRRGWFIAPPRFVIDAKRKVNFNTMAKEQGRIAKTQVLKIETFPASSPLKEAMQVSGKQMLLSVRRVRSLDDRPVLIEDLYFDTRRFPDFEKFDLSQSITELQGNHYGITIGSETSNIQVGSLKTDQAVALGCSDGHPCLKILRWRYDQQNKLVDFNIEHWLHNSAEIVVSA
jgi:DNA-binding GntR family transcriptional regulator